MLSFHLTAVTKIDYSDHTGKTTKDKLLNLPKIVLMMIPNSLPKRIKKFARSVL